MMISYPPTTPTKFAEPVEVSRWGAIRLLSIESLYIVEVRGDRVFTSWDRDRAVGEFWRLCEFD